ncbi:M55 family metallopeptidase [candidate division WOR-3 bacterium]|nr:M55 family metallopeptidase [candidate division WOR-3 bacterium]
MKIFVVCDLEGTAGVVDMRRQCGLEGPYYIQARKMATLELNALAEGALEGGATEIRAWDGHCNFPAGLDVELVHPACRLVMGSGDGGPQGLDDSFDALFQLGLHAMAGTSKAVLAHSFTPNIAECSVNGMPVGEIWMNAYLAGSYDVPFVFIAGDRAAAEEAKEIVPEVETAVVKEGLSADPVPVFKVAPAITLAPEKAREVIRDAAKRAMSKIGKIKPYKMKPPYVCRTTFRDPKFAERAKSQPGVKLTDAVTVEIERSDHPWVVIL